MDPKLTIPSSLHFEVGLKPSPVTFNLTNTTSVVFAFKMKIAVSAQSQGKLPYYVSPSRGFIMPGSSREIKAIRDALSASDLKKTSFAVENLAVDSVYLTTPPDDCGPDANPPDSLFAKPNPFSRVVIPCELRKADEAAPVTQPLPQPPAAVGPAPTPSSLARSAPFAPPAPPSSNPPPPQVSIADPKPSKEFGGFDEYRKQKALLNHIPSNDRARPPASESRAQPVDRKDVPFTRHQRNPSRDMAANQGRAPQQAEGRLAPEELDKPGASYSSFAGTDMSRLLSNNYSFYQIFFTALLCYLIGRFASSQ
eukprot:gnl/Spiro4/23499_TR11614_c0_g1_i1.p1 gnl/Spiro4/23499_TR11614_c0_g1~~gnl/Spiro4/23499_TR11614_c0_g1_i1.p1  ORF type:complete len:329 (+),score=62.06 gnl/Spiro4/23499_TR11614_c0_g1_i1:59-988(+)